MRWPAPARTPAGAVVGASGRAAGDRAPPSAAVGQRFGHRHQQVSSRDSSKERRGRPVPQDYSSNVVRMAEPTGPTSSLDIGRRVVAVVDDDTTAAALRTGLAALGDDFELRRGDIRAATRYFEKASPAQALDRRYLGHRQSAGRARRPRAGVPARRPGVRHRRKRRYRLLSVAGAGSRRHRIPAQAGDARPGAAAAAAASGDRHQRSAAAGAGRPPRRGLRRARWRRHQQHRAEPGLRDHGHGEGPRRAGGPARAGRRGRADAVGASRAWPAHRAGGRRPGRQPVPGACLDRDRAAAAADRLGGSVRHRGDGDRGRAGARARSAAARSSITSSPISRCRCRPRCCGC